MKDIINNHGKPKHLKNSFEPGKFTILFKGYGNGYYSREKGEKH